MALGPTSLRGRLALLFGIGSGVLVLISALVLAVTINTAVQNGINNELRTRAEDLSADLRAGDIHVRPEEAFAEVVSLDGRVLAASRTIVNQRRILGPSELARAATGEFLIDRHVPGLEGRARLLALPASSGNAKVVIVVGGSREALIEARNRLALALVIVGPLLVLALSTGGWIVAGAALRPVRRMAEEADAISLLEPGRRLPQPDGHDEIAQLGRTLNSMLDRIEATFAHEQAFVDDASHELRTPVSILRAELELALLQPGDAAEVERALRSSLEEAERLSRLADDLLVLARAGAGQLPLRKEDVDLRGLAQDVAARTAVHSPGPAVDIVGAPTMVNADKARVEQILVNLVINARRFARSRVQVEVLPQAAAVTVAVADDGPGFPTELLPSVFDRFTRSDTARGREAGGAGLGLSIVAALVHAHGGRVKASNGGPLGGAVVTVTIPTAPERKAVATVRR
ncbi:MAG TPA: ATP-binding protein [Acidimicrobiales bacterium]|nr:ATP-binding protein [Acidimicrobiales bacterium]